MILTEDEIEQAARTLMETATKQTWDKADVAQRRVYKELIEKLAGALDVPHSPESVAVFMTWMGDDNAFKEFGEIKCSGANE
jgi:hypothetical protein